MIPGVTDQNAAELWASFPHDPRNPALAQLRASDADRREALGAFLTVTLICWVIWVVVMPGGFPWPLFPMLGTGINLVRVVAGRRDILAAEVRRLEKKRAKELRARDEGPPAT